MKQAPLRIVVSALDWGLGHASRCVPLIEALQAQGAKVMLASSGLALRFWQQRFPDVASVSLPGYEVRYSAGRYQWPTILRQVPRLLGVIGAEHRALGDLVKHWSPDGIISDHRYGCWSPTVPSVWLGHQLALRLPVGLRGWQGPLAQAHARWLRPFDALWVPDAPPPQGLAGALVSDFPAGKKPLTYVGPLSRLASLAPPQNWPPVLAGTPAPYVALLSGPEPQRSQLEASLRAQAPGLPAELWIIRGQPGPLQVTLEGQVRLISFLDGPLLAGVLQQARCVVARSGYSSLMDFAALRLPRLLLVPTPGQTEQIYLARRWEAHGWAHCSPQADLALPAQLMALEAATPSHRHPWPAASTALSDALVPWLASLRESRG
jgi:hypothetical protein